MKEEMLGNICFCGKEKREDRLTCPHCFELYRQQTKGKIGLLEWTKKQASAKLEDLGASKENPKTNLEMDLETKKKELRELEDRLPEEVSLVLQERLTGAGRLRLEEVEALREDIRKEVWKEKGGNRLYAEFKDLQKEVQSKVAPIREVLQEIEKTEKDQEPVNQLIKSVFPNTKL